jgi:hypothetical protein
MSKTEEFVFRFKNNIPLSELNWSKTKIYIYRDNRVFSGYRGGLSMENGEPKFMGVIILHDPDRGITHAISDNLTESFSFQHKMPSLTSPSISTDPVGRAIGIQSEPSQSTAQIPLIIDAPPIQPLNVLPTIDGSTTSAALANQVIPSTAQDAQTGTVRLGVVVHNPTNDPLTNAPIPPIESDKSAEKYLKALNNDDENSDPIDI